jgi:hypothetical protein
MSHITELFKGLMFLHGHFTHQEDLDPGFAPLGNRAASARWFAGNPGVGATADPPARARRRAHPRTDVVARLLRNLEYLGGRPMTAGHNVDIEEPLPQSVATAPAKRSTRTTSSRTKPCVTRHGAIAAVCGTVALSPFR